MISFIERREKLSYRTNDSIKYLLFLTIIYIFTHWFLLVATGQWWDDWVYADHDVEYMKDVWLQSSLPLRAYINMAVWNTDFRVIVFAMFYIDAVILYYILNRTGLFNKDESFYIDAIFLTFPINDARITFICFGYSFCFFLFWCSFYAASISNECKKSKKVIFRLISLLFLFISFDTESIMIMAIVIYLYLCYKDYMYIVNDKKIIKIFMKNFDYIIIPIIWYVLDKTLFPGYGAYGGYNAIDWGKVIETMFKSPIYTLQTLKSVLNNYWQTLKIPFVLFLIVAILLVRNIYDFVKCKQQRLQYNCIGLKDGVVVLLGAILFYLGAFPYLIRRGSGIGTVGPDGRDSLLLGLGGAILFFELTKMIRHKMVQKSLLLLIITLGMVHFNLEYMDWQEAYYQQLEFRDEISENKQIDGDDTFLTIFNQYKIPIYSWQLNGNAYMVTGEQNRLFLSGIDDIQWFIDLNEDSYFLKGFMMKDYNLSDKIIDGVFFVNYSDTSYGQVLKLKAQEFFDKEKFVKEIKSMKNIEYIKISPETSEKIIDAYTEGKLNFNNLVTIQSHAN